MSETSHRGRPQFLRYYGKVRLHSQSITSICSTHEKINMCSPAKLLLFYAVVSIFKFQNVLRKKGNYRVIAVNFYLWTGAA